MIYFSYLTPLHCNKHLGLSKVKKCTQQNHRAQKGCTAQNLVECAPNCGEASSTAGPTPSLLIIGTKTQEMSLASSMASSAT